MPICGRIININCMQGNPRQSYILYSTPWIRDSLSVNSGFQSLGGFYILLAVFRIPQTKISRIPKSGFSCKGRNIVV